MYYYAPLRMKKTRPILWMHGVCSVLMGSWIVACYECCCCYRCKQHSSFCYAVELAELSSISYKRHGHLSLSYMKKKNETVIAFDGALCNSDSPPVNQLNAKSGGKRLIS